MSSVDIHSECFDTAIQLARAWCDEHKIPEDHGISHALTVVENARLAFNDFILSHDQQLAVLLAALFHDLEDRKYVPSDNLSGTRGILQKLSSLFAVVDSGMIELTIKMIGLVSCSKNGNTIDETLPKWYYIPRDADRIEALGLIGIKRAYETTIGFKLRGKAQFDFYTDETIRCTSREELQKVATPERMIEYMKTGYSKSMIDHYYDKLLHIRVLASGSTSLQKIADERHEIMVNFVLEFGRGRLVPLDSL